MEFNRKNNTYFATTSIYLKKKRWLGDILFLSFLSSWNISKCPLLFKHYPTIRGLFLVRLASNDAKFQYLIKKKPPNFQIWMNVPVSHVRMEDLVMMKLMDILVPVLSLLRDIIARPVSMKQDNQFWACSFILE